MYSNYCPPRVYELFKEGTNGYRLGKFFQTPSVLPWVSRPSLDYPTVNPPIQIFMWDGKSSDNVSHG